MKKNRIFFFCILVFMAFTSCTFDDEPLINDYTIVRFPNQTYVRNLIIGEGLEMNVGVTFSGVLQNTQQREVGYVIDPTRIPTGKEVLPSDYYTLGHASTITIPKGSLDGYLNVKLDSAKFVNDPKSLDGTYVLPFRLVSVNNIDSINVEKDSMVIQISYFAKQQSNYTYAGMVIKTKDSNIDTLFYKNNPLQNSSFRLLKTVGPTKMELVPDPNGTNDYIKGKCLLELDVPIAGGSVEIAAAPTSPIAVTQSGESSYNTDSRTFILNYSYTMTDGTLCNATDTMVFRNRIRDVQSNGVYINEWW